MCFVDACIFRKTDLIPDAQKNDPQLSYSWASGNNLHRIKNISKNDFDIIINFQFNVVRLNDC